MGLLTRWAALATVLLLTILLWRQQAQWGFYMNWLGDPTRGHGMEFSLALIGALCCMLLTGPGEWSFDGRRAYTVASRAAGRARLRGRA